jgi:hypothetical protein
MGPRTAGSRHVSGGGKGEPLMSWRSVRVSKPVMGSVAALVAIALLGGIWIVSSSSDKAVGDGATPTVAASPSASVNAEPSATVPPPSPGTPSATGSGETVRVRPVKTKEPVPLNKTADFETGLTVKISDIDSVKGVAKVPGEIAGPALKISVVADNSSKAAIDLRSVVVFVTYGQKHTPAVKLSKGTRPLEGSLPPDTQTDGTYVFTVPRSDRDLVRIEVSYSGKAPTVSFEGAV